jgi:oligogalacturonide lyase
MERLFFISNRHGRPEIFAELQSIGEIQQITHRTDLGEWSIYPSHCGNYIYYAAGNGAFHMDLNTLQEEMLLDLSSYVSHRKEMIGRSMGTTALSFCDQYWAIRISSGDGSRLVVINTRTGESEIILERDHISHMMFCPDDSSLLFYAGPLTDRVWCIRRDGSENRRLYMRNPDEWITHESWIPGTREIAFVDWPKGIRAVSVDTGEIRQVTTFNAWHAICDCTGTQMVADTNFPDIGIQIFDPRDGVGKPTTLCYPEASSIGEHWKGPFPYAEGPIKVYAPQHTHPHPSFSPDGARVVFTSDRTGYAQVYEAMLR